MRQERVYVIRLWRDSDRPDTWRASLEDMRTREKKAFENVQALYGFLDEQRGAQEKEGGD